MLENIERKIRDSSGVVAGAGVFALVSIGSRSPVPESSITSGTGFPWATSQTRRSRTAVIARSFLNSAGKFTVP